MFLCAIFSGLTGTQKGDCLREKGKSLWFRFLCEVKLLTNRFGKCLMDEHSGIDVATIVFLDSETVVKILGRLGPE